MQRWDVKQAEKYLASLGQTMQLLVEHSGLVTKIDNVKNGYKKLPPASHLLIFMATLGAVEIARVLHKSMDVEQHL